MYFNCNQCGYIGVKLYQQTHICYYCIDDFDVKLFDYKKEITTVKKNPDRWYPDDHLIYSYKDNNSHRDSSYRRNSYIVTGLFYMNGVYYFTQLKTDNLLEEKPEPRMYMIMDNIRYEIKEKEKKRKPRNHVSNPDEIDWIFQGSADQFVKFLLKESTRRSSDLNKKFIKDFLEKCPIINKYYCLESEFKPKPDGKKRSSDVCR